MKDKIINVIIIVFFLIWTIGTIFITKKYFPTVVTNEIKIPPTEHELQELATQIAEDEIQKAQEYWKEYSKAHPKIIYVPGKDSTYMDTVTVYPKSSIDVKKTFRWSFVFPNKARAADSLDFVVIDSLRVIAYEDSAGTSYIGHENYTQTIDSLRMVVAPQIFEREIITRFALYIGAGFGIESDEQIRDGVIYKNNYFTGTGEIMGVFNERWYAKFYGAANSRSQTIGVLGGIKLFGIFNKEQIKK